MIALSNLEIFTGEIVFLTLRELIFANIFIGHFAGIIFHEVGFMKDFPGINFDEWGLTKDFDGFNFRERDLCKGFAGIEFPVCLKELFSRPYLGVLKIVKIDTFLLKQKIEIIDGFVKT